MVDGFREEHKPHADVLAAGRVRLRVVLELEQPREAHIHARLFLRLPDRGGFGGFAGVDATAGQPVARTCKLLDQQEMLRHGMPTHHERKAVQSGLGIAEFAGEVAAARWAVRVVKVDLERRGPAVGLALLVQAYGAGEVRSVLLVDVMEGTMDPQRVFRETGLAAERACIVLVAPRSRRARHRKFCVFFGGKFEQNACQRVHGIGDHGRTVGEASIPPHGVVRNVRREHAQEELSTHLTQRAQKLQKSVHWKRSHDAEDHQVHLV
ncbi:hypothetical protein H257_02412 [Aphanomyces astaci]|uniref:Uncharacterized protein n=1 Tax=Aphanomyces astaci TaxID=112090 RepID=W4H3M0_APHAT|nr:hypothetical protein H257_02412 [Aphanomyces astaci]ETV85864.1 hypothetical protein H257_02412 [Aphanomyces astaci]|eukprot:XP_009824336.1 hypothetical protein H257_02412 [Aphanomyces astaci]